MNSQIGIAELVKIPSLGSLWVYGIKDDGGAISGPRSLWCDNGHVHFYKKSCLEESSWMFWIFMTKFQLFVVWMRFLTKINAHHWIIPYTLYVYIYIHILYTYKWYVFKYKCITVRHLINLCCWKFQNGASFHATWNRIFFPSTVPLTCQPCFKVGKDHVISGLRFLIHKWGAGAIAIRMASGAQKLVTVFIEEMLLSK